MSGTETDGAIERAAELLRDARHAIAFTGAGVSVESGIPPFRGPGGLWERVDPTFIEIGHFRTHTEESWRRIKQLFYDGFGRAEPNAAHLALAELERRGLIARVITQNIDMLHQRAGNRDVVEFHGTLRSLTCMGCGRDFESGEVSLDPLPPRCPACGAVLKPDFVFFGELIPEQAQSAAFAEAGRADLVLVIGTTGEVMPACMIPHMAKDRGACIIEINLAPSAFTHGVTDVYLEGTATEMMTRLLAAVG